MQFCRWAGNLSFASPPPLPSPPPPEPSPPPQPLTKRRTSAPANDACRSILRDLSPLAARPSAEGAGCGHREAALGSHDSLRDQVGLGALAEERALFAADEGAE